MKRPPSSRTGAADERDRRPRLPVSAVSGRGSAPGPGAARTNKPAAQSARRTGASVVCRRRGESPGPGWGAPGGPDHGPGRADDPAGPAGSGRLAGRRAGQAAAAGRGRAATGRKKDPAIVTALEGLVEPVTAGDPMSEEKWVRASLRYLSRRLGEAGHPA